MDLTADQALVVLHAIDSGRWKLTRFLPSGYLTDEANAERAWGVERQLPPFCDSKGNRIWFGTSAFEALANARGCFTQSNW